MIGAIHVVHWLKLGAWNFAVERRALPHLYLYIGCWLTMGRNGRLGSWSWDGTYQICTWYLCTFVRFNL
jgi:hypothetical protein